MYATIDQFVHLPMISLEYGASRVTNISSGERFRLQKKLRVIASDQDKFIFPIFKIKCGSGFVDRDFT
jgi:hypothetical protein